jgi:hypothetical protein
MGSANTRTDAVSCDTFAAYANASGENAGAVATDRSASEPRRASLDLERVTRTSYVRVVTRSSAVTVTAIGAFLP